MNCRNCAKETSQLIQDRCEQCFEAGLGVTMSNPYVNVPQHFDPHGLPYGAYCKCRLCGVIARSTHVFDFYRVDKTNPEAGLKCENCALHNGSMQGEQNVLIAMEKAVREVYQKESQS